MNEIHLNRLCVGSSFITLLYSLRTSTPCIIHNPQKIFSYTDELDNLDFGLVADSPSTIWDRVCFLLSMSGLLLFPDNIQSLRKESDLLKSLQNITKKPPFISMRLCSLIIERPNISVFTTIFGAELVALMKLI